MQLDTNRVIGLYAPQNYGKTYLAKKLIETIASHVPVFIYDTNFERATAYPQFKHNIKFVKCSDISQQDNPAFLNKAILTLRAKYSNFFFVIEDLDKIIETSGRSKETLEIFKLSSDSRHQRIGLIYMSKEPTNIPVKLRTNTNLFFFGNFIEPAHVKTISQIIPKGIMQTLKPHEFVMLDRYTNNVEKVMA